MNKHVRQKLILLLITSLFPWFGNLAFGQAGPAIIFGASPNPVGSGARALGQGNAFIAHADDATAASWNPAGLTLLTAPELSFAVEARHFAEEISSSTNPVSEKSRNFSLSDLNYLSLAWNYPYREARNLTVSLNYLKLLRFDKSVDFPVRIRGSDNPPPIGIGNFEDNFVFDFDREGTFSVLAPALGIMISNKLSLGITLNLWDHSITGDSRYTETETRVGTSKSELGDTEFLVFEKNRFEVDGGYSLVFGGLYELTEQINVGLVYKPHYVLEIDYRRDRKIVQTGFSPFTFMPPTIKEEAELQFPGIFGLGLAWHPHQKNGVGGAMTVAFDATWTDWSDYVFEDENGDKTNPVTGRSISRGKLRDTYTFRLGLEYLIKGQTHILPLRCGFGYDPETSVDEVDDFFTFSVGSGLQWDRFMFDIAYEYRWGNNVNGSFLRGINGNQDVSQHRILASLILYLPGNR